MKRRAQRRYYLQRRRRQSTRSGIRKKAVKSGGRRSTAFSNKNKKPTYFSLLADVEQMLKVEHKEGASLQTLKRELEQRYGGRKFDVASHKMLQSAVKRLRNRGRIAKIHPNSTLFRIKPPVLPTNYNFFSPGSANSRVIPQVGAKAPPRQRSMSISGSVTMSKSRSRTGSRPGSRSTTSRSQSNSVGKRASRALSVRKQVSRAKRRR